MKKFTVAILAFIYLGVSSGIAMNVHYCMGKISSIDLVHGKDKCGKCGMKSGGSGCCKNEIKIVKLGDSHTLIADNLNLLVPVGIIPVYENNFISQPFQAHTSSLINNNSPPDLSGRSLCILHSVFRI